MSKQITYAPVIPLIGGMPLAAEKVLGYPPVAVYSYTGFWDNDSQYMNYQNNTLGRNLDYIIMDPNGKYTPVDFTICTPPCAGLSSMNTGKSEAIKGAGCAKNDWMYQVAKDSIDLLSAKVVIIENAPGLYSTKGKPVADKLFAIAKERGYSLTLYRTNTIFHGIPQNRDRTFALLWKSDVAPIMNYYDRPRAKFTEYIQDIPGDAGQREDFVKNRFTHDVYFNFITAKTGSRIAARKALLESGYVTCLTYVIRFKLVDECYAWAKEFATEKEANTVAHYINKHAKGLGVWDSSLKVYDDYMNAVITRNITDTIHPVEDRMFSVREAFHMMAFPHNFELMGGQKNYPVITQNVPVCTAADIITEAIKFIENKLILSTSDHIKQTNYAKKVEFSTDSHRITLDDLGNM